MSTQVSSPPTEIEHLSRTNDPPSISTRHNCETLLEEVSSNLGQLNDEISRLEENLIFLRQEKERLSGYASVYKRVLHPVRCLPDMLLVDIFQKCMDTKDFMVFRRADPGSEANPQDSLNPTKPPWTLSQVCRQWRTAALSCSSLWSTISAVIPRTYSTSPQRVTALVSRLISQVQRSKSQHLTVSLISQSEPISIDDNHPLLVAICSHSARWERLHIRFELNPVEGLRAISYMIRENIPNLRHLFLDLREDTLDNQAIINGFELAPRLQVLTILYYNTKPMETLRLPWQQIRRYIGLVPRGRHTDRSDDFRFLTKMSNIEALYYQHFLAGNVSHISAMRLSSLHTLSIHLPPASHLGTLLDHLTCDNMRDLRIRGYSETMSSLKSFLIRSAPSLQAFWLDVGALSPTQAVELLELTPNLTSLMLRNASPGICLALARCEGRSAQHVLVPRLREVSLFIPFTNEPESLLEMIESRIKCNHFKVLRLDTTLRLREATWARLELLRGRIEVQSFEALWFFFSPDTT